MASSWRDLAANLVNFALEPLLLDADVDDAGKRQRKRRLVEHDLHRARGAFRINAVEPGKTQDGVLVTGDAGLGHLTRAGDDERHLGAGRNVHLGAHRAHLRDEPDQPADLGVGFRVLQALRCSGHGASIRQACPAARTSSPSFAHSSSVTNGMKGCSS